MDEHPHLTVADTACANCGAARVGKWCHDCGQHEEMTHRSVRRLGVEAFEHLTSLDGKILRTLRGLALHPAALTSSYLEGKRVAQVPPLSLFLVILVVFLFIAGQQVHVEMLPPTAAQAAQIPHYMRWIVPLSVTLRDHSGRFLGAMAESAELFGLLTVPVAALLLWGLFAGRRHRLYDHLIFALHSLSFQFVVVGLILLLPDSWGILANPLMVVMAAHLFIHMRGVYGGGVASTLLRMAALGLGTAVAYSILLAAWIAVAFAALWV
jgi:hypothetical protein